MADEITIGTKAIKEVQDLRAELIKLSQDALNAGKTLSNISTPGMLNKSGSDNANASAQLDTFKTKYVALSETIQKGAEKSRLAEIRLQQQRERAFDSFERNAKKEQATLEKTNSVYNRTQTQINNLTKAYNDLAIKKERYNNLSAYEESRLKTLQAVTEKYNGVLKNTDAQIGKYGRNVGNYSSQWNGLGNAVNQLTREAPAFANSLNTGFMALSNNIPILFDELTKLRQANVELAKSGQPTKSIFGQLTGALFSWGTALSLGVTLLTLYGGTLIDSITGSKKKKEALEAEKKALEEKTKAEQDARDAIANVQAIEVSRSKILFETAKNLTLSYKQRSEAVKELQQRYPDYLGHLSKEEILAGDTAKAEEELNSALINRGKALAAQKFLQTNLEKQLSLEIELAKLNEKKFKYDAESSKNASKIVNGIQQINISTNKQKQIADQKFTSERNANNESIVALNEKLRLLRNEQDAFLGVYNENAKYLDTVKETTKEKNEQAKTSKIESVNQLELNRVQDGALFRLKQLKTALEITRDETGKNASEFEAYNKSIEDVNKAIDVLTKPISVDVKIYGIPESKKEIKELSQYMQSFLDDFSSSAGFSSTFEILQGKVKDFGKDFKTTFNGIAEIVQETFNFINQNSEANFTAEKTRLENQYDVALKYAGDNKAAQEKLAADLEKSKKDIAYREAKAKQKQAIFNIAIDTAQGIVSALASTPPNIILSAIIAGIGAAQIAMVSSQEIPQYWMGGTHYGGLMMVNDGKGSNYRETIVTPDGKIMKPQGRNVVMDAPAGTEIFTHDQWQNTLTDMLKGKGIDRYVPQQNYSGISKSDMKDVLMETIGGQSQSLINFDENGITQSFINKGNKTTAYTKRGNSTKLRF